MSISITIKSTKGLVQYKWNPASALTTVAAADANGNGISETDGQGNALAPSYELKYAAEDSAGNHRVFCVADVLVAAARYICEHRNTVRGPWGAVDLVDKLGKRTQRGHGLAKWYDCAARARNVEAPVFCVSACG